MFNRIMCLYDPSTHAFHVSTQNEILISHGQPSLFLSNILHALAEANLKELHGLHRPSLTQIATSPSGCPLLLPGLPSIMIAPATMSLLQLVLLAAMAC